MSGFVFHLPASAFAGEGEGLKPFYRKLMAGLKEAGYEVAQVRHDRDRAVAHVEADDRFHLFDHGRVVHPRALNTGIAYIYPFWNVDPHGIRAFSSIGSQPFDPGMVDADEARAFFGRLRHRLVKKRTSRYPQPEEIEAGLPEGAIAVFLQSESHRDVGEACYLTMNEMVEAVLAGAKGRPVIIKPHPRDLEIDIFQWLDGLTSTHPNLTISAGNIHDILAVAERVVTVNSAVGIEAQLHNLPVILCGHADFHHVCHSAKTAEDLGRLLQADLPAQPVEAYLYWYFRIQCLATSDEDLTRKFLDRVASRGFAV